MKVQREGAPESEALEPEGRHMARFVGFPHEADPGERIETTVFELCGKRWALWVCPGGMTEEHAEFVSVFLAYKGETSVQARFQFTLIDPLGVRTTVFADDANGSRFEGYDDHWGKHNCLRRSELSVICPEGEFAIEVGMTLPHKPQQAYNKPTVPPSSLVHDFSTLLDSEIGAKRNNLLLVPRWLLIHSQYFSTQ
jgi:hypothetical protein